MKNKKEITKINRRMNKRHYWGILLVLIFLFHHATKTLADSSVGKSDYFFSFDEQIINGTTGTPLGGFGCGGVKFDANTGNFSVMVTPPADAYDFKHKEGALLQFYSNRKGYVEVKETLKASLTNGRPNDDAIWPLHLVDFGCINGVQVNMTGISPLDNQDYNNMHLPYALYEITLTNMQDSDVTSAFAFQWSSGNSSLLSLPEKGIYNDEWSVMAKCNNRKAEISIGDDAAGDFLRKGICVDSEAQTNTKKVAVKLNLSAHETQKIYFVLAWYDRTDPEIGYYKNLYQGPKEIAEHGLKVFSVLKNNAEKLATGMRTSNLPGWLKNQTLNSAVAIVTNSMYKKDGRVAFAEGQWTCFGTMDQMWLARQIINQLLPFYAWQELNYWARTQMNNGQIHHDFNVMEVGEEREKRSLLVAWDHTEHSDYRDIQKWVDLNCGFIISVFEVYRATSDQKQFDFLWSYVKKAAQRILDQVEQYGSKKYPFTFDGTENSYDAGGNPDPYNATLSAVAYKIMMLLADEKGDDELLKRYENAYNMVRKSFHDRYIRDNEFAVGRHCESVYTGQWLAFHLKLGEIWNKEDTDYILNKLENYYYPYYWGLGYPEGTYDEWTPYIVPHYGGLLLHTGRLDQWYVLQKDSYARQYWDRDRVFAHPLNILPMVDEPKWVSTNIKSKMQYISVPSLWRNYYDIIGFHRDLRTKELWIKPIVPKTMNNELKDAMFISPEGYGYISYKEISGNILKKEIVVRSEKAMKVSTLYLTDNFKGDVSVTIDGKPCLYEKVGTGYAKELAVNWNNRITEKGIRIVVEGVPDIEEIPLPVKPAVGTKFTPTVSKMSPYKTMEAEKADKLAGVVVAGSDAGIRYITSCNNFDYIQFSNIDFGHKGTTKFKARVSSQLANSEMEIVLDDTSGTVIGSLKIPNTGGEETWIELECEVKKVVGVHNIVFRFFGSSSENLMNIDWLRFE